MVAQPDYSTFAETPASYWFRDGAHQKSVPNIIIFSIQFWNLFLISSRYCWYWYRYLVFISLKNCLFSLIKCFFSFIKCYASLTYRPQAHGTISKKRHLPKKSSCIILFLYDTIESWFLCNLQKVMQPALIAPAKLALLMSFLISVNNSSHPAVRQLSPFSFGPRLH